MTEDPIITSDPNADPSPVDKLRAEFQEQFETLKKSFEGQKAESDKLIESLKKENEELHRSLIRSAMIPTPEKPLAEKTAEEKYNEEIETLAKKTVSMMKGV